MMKTALLYELCSIRDELAWLQKQEENHNPDWRFSPTPYSKRRARLIKTYWALKAMQKPN